MTVKIKTIEVEGVEFVRLSDVSHYDKPIDLKDYIKSKGVSQKQFAKNNGAIPQDISRWVTQKMVVINNVPYTPCRRGKAFK